MDIRSGGKPDTGLDIPESAKNADNKKTRSKKRGMKVLLSTLIIVVVLIVAGYLVDKYTNISLLGGRGIIPNNLTKVGKNYDINSYYAVFLTNGQVYFGKITDNDNHSMVLQDIYYLQISNPLQQVPPTAAGQQPQLTLVKLGNELHGPQDYMKINNSQVIFIEELKKDGKVVEAITQYKASGSTNPDLSN